MYRVEAILPPTPGPDGGLGQTAGPSWAFVPSYRQTISFPKRKAKKFIKFSGSCVPYTFHQGEGQGNSGEWAGCIPQKTSRPQNQEISDSVGGLSHVRRLGRRSKVRLPRETDLSGRWQTNIPPGKSDRPGPGARGWAAVSRYHKQQWFPPWNSSLRMLKIHPPAQGRHTDYYMPDGPRYVPVFVHRRRKFLASIFRPAFLQGKTKAPVLRTGAFANQEALLELESDEASDAVSSSASSSSAAVSSWAEREMRVSTESADSRYTAGSPESWA